MSLPVKGNLFNPTPVVIGMDAIGFPCTVTLRSAAPGRKIEISTDGGIEFFSPAMDMISPTMVVVALLSPVSCVRFTGAVNNEWILLPSKG